MSETLKSGARPLTAEQSQRIGILKVWLTIMVIFIHSYGEGANFSDGNISFQIPAWLAVFKYAVSKVISTSAVPTFFFLSAFFLYSKPFSWRQNLKRKCRSLFAPYLILNTFWIIVFASAQHIAFLSPFFSDSRNIISNWDVSDWLHAYLGSPSTLFPADSYPMLYPLWFMRDLITLNILAKVYSAFVSKLPRLSIAAFLLTWICTDQEPVFCLSIQAICFWGMGCWFAERKRSFDEFDKVNQTFLGVAYAILIVVRCALRLYEGIFFIPLHHLCAFVGAVFWYAFATKLEGKLKEGLLFVSRYTFCVYLFHEYTLGVSRKIAVRLLPVTPLFQVALYCLLPFVIFALCVAWSVAFEKRLPKVYAVLSGGRHQ